jgi:dimethylargininase
MRALTHLPSPKLALGERTHIARLPIDYGLALRQHEAYCQMLCVCGAEVQTLHVNRDLPDSTFIEDTAVVLDEAAVLASMGAPSRRDEPAGIEKELKKNREVHRLEASSTLEGGDVLRVGRNLLVGMSSRTNSAGARAFATIVQRYGYRVVPVPVLWCLHLKTAVTALPDGRLLVNPRWLEKSRLREFEMVAVPQEEPWAANTLSIGGAVCLAAAHVRTADLLRRLGFDVRTVDLSEFAKAEGCVTCLSLVFDDG